VCHRAACDGAGTCVAGPACMPSAKVAFFSRSSSSPTNAKPDVRVLLGIAFPLLCLLAAAGLGVAILLTRVGETDLSHDS
jgi:hypothetical protein